MNATATLHRAKPLQSTERGAIVINFDPETMEAYAFRSRKEAYAHWQDFPAGEWRELLADGRWRSVADDFSDWREEDERDARSQARHNASYSRPA